MQTDRPVEVKAVHLARKAVVYMRQSTDEQVLKNTGSADYQRNQVRYPVDWGWPTELIEVVDSDLGLSGTAAAHRPGYQRLVQEIERGEVGALFLGDLTRGGRDAAEWFRLLELCRRHNVLIVVDGKVYDPKDATGLLVTRILATIAEHDNNARRETMLHGRIAKAEKGQAVSRPPSGYVRVANGSWERDPDPAVQAAIAAIFRTFREERSCARTVQALKASGVKLPRRKRAALWWAEPTVPKVYRFLTHPAYKGDYPYRRLISDPSRGRDRYGRVRTRKAARDEIILTKNHHEAYVSPAEWDEIQTTLRLNGPSQDRRNLGPGSGLCQGIIRCAMHRNQAMATVYKPARADGNRSHGYQCMGDYHHGGRFCGCTSGPQVDRAVVDAVMQRVSPPGLEAIRDAARAATAGESAELHRRKIELHRVREQETLLEQKFLNLDESSVEIAKSLESKLEAAKRQIARLERELVSELSPVARFDDAAFAELVQLSGDLRALWNEPTTTNQDRKQILRILIRNVVLEHRDAERIRLRIVWNDGTPDTETGSALGGRADKLIAEMEAAGLHAEEIAARLNELGIRTLSGRSFEPRVIAQRFRNRERRNKRKTVSHRRCASTR